MQQKLEAAIRAELERQANRDPNDALWYERERWFGKDGRDIVDGWLDVPALAQAILTTLIGHHADLHTADCRCAVYDLLTVDISGGG